MQPDTAHYHCGSFEEVKKRKKEAGVDDSKEEVDADAIERELKRLEHYSTRYFEHQSSVKFAQT